ncbi:hypothetical protein HT136_24770 [Novosphingobium profundi]|uniref:hypothetical protein n=1 Tax=Novosphingobium profundi TaxID=1774954 RepID=UPI001BDAF59E|nr:hypothetical protein [Novosphingobium profundi]MBT0671588.1 hypothetical protein [Novosphingobium profundi]
MSTNSTVDLTQFSANCSEIDIANGAATIIKEVMKRKNVSVRDLHRSGLISDRARRQFFDKLSSGSLPIGDLFQIFAYLDIDPIQTLVALSGMHDPMAFFNPHCKTASRYAKHIAVILNEIIPACEGDFAPISDNLCRSHAHKTSSAIAAHHNRVAQYSQQPIE